MTNARPLCVRPSPAPLCLSSPFPALFSLSLPPRVVGYHWLRRVWWGEAARFAIRKENEGEEANKKKEEEEKKKKGKRALRGC